MLVQLNSHQHKALQKTVCYIPSVKAYKKIKISLIENAYLIQNINNFNNNNKAKLNINAD